MAAACTTSPTAGEQIEQALKDFPDTRSVFAERSEGGRYLDIVPDREALARYNLSVDDINQVVEMAIGGNTIGYTVEGRERYPISVRLQRDFRDSISAIRQIPVAVPGGAQVPLIGTGFHRIFERTARSAQRKWPIGDLRFGRHASPATSAATCSGQESGCIKWSTLRPVSIGNGPDRSSNCSRSKARLLVIIPFTLLIIILLIYVNTRSFVKTCIVLLAVPFSLVGAFWLLYLCGYQFSVAVAVGLIALAGIDAETGVVMLIYLDQAYDDRVARGAMNNFNDLIAAVKEGAVQRIRPKMMTMAAILFGLLAHHVEHRLRLRSHEAHRRTHDRRRGHLGNLGVAALSGALRSVARTAIHFGHKKRGSNCPLKRMDFHC